jgi:hypothetical protein
MCVLGLALWCFVGAFLFDANHPPPPGSFKSMVLLSMILVPLGLVFIFSGWDHGQQATGDSFVHIDRDEHPRTFAFYNRSMIVIGCVILGGAVLAWIKYLV